MPIEHAPHAQPLAGEVVIGCKHAPDPWEEPVEFFGFKRPVVFSGIKTTRQMTIDKPAQWFLACTVCAAEVHRTAEREPGRVMQCIGDLAGASGVWPRNAKPLRLVVKDRGTAH